MDHAQKLAFLRQDFAERLRSMDPATPPAWGLMNLHQMVEHFGDAVRLAAGEFSAPLVTPEEHLPKMREFLFSDKPFRENTKNPLMGDTPAPVRFANVETAITKLQAAIDRFVASYEADPSREVLNPFFGVLDFRGQVHLLYKHARHHLRQFGVELPA